MFTHGSHQLQTKTKKINTAISDNICLSLHTAIIVYVLAEVLNERPVKRGLVYIWYKLQFHWLMGVLSRDSLVEMKLFKLRVQGQELETRWSGSTRDQGEQERRIIYRLFTYWQSLTYGGQCLGSKWRFWQKPAVRVGHDDA